MTGTMMAHALSAALLHFVWQGSLVAVLLWTALFGLRKRPAVWRYGASCAALALLAALPPATAWFLMRGARQAADVASGAPSGFLAVAAGVAHRGIPDPAVSWLAALERWALPVWSLGVLFLSIRLVWGARWLYGLRRRGEPASAAMLATVEGIAVRMGVWQPVAVWISAMADGPSVVGWIRPLILLPSATLLGLTPEQLEAVLAHELAHIRRFDYAVNLAQMLVETLLFYHPAVWWVSSRIRHERELCCDDLAVEACGNALCYARALTRLERLRISTPGMAMASTGGPLLYRIQRLMGAATAEYRTSRLPAILMVLVGFACLALNVHWAKAQEQQTAPPPKQITITRDGKTLTWNVLGPDAQQNAVVRGTVMLDDGSIRFRPTRDLGIQVDAGGAKILKTEPVEYPESAIGKNIQGTVTVEAILDADGEVSDAHVIAGPQELRKAALQSVLEWRFEKDAAGAGASRMVNIGFQIPPGGFPKEPAEPGADGIVIRDGNIGVARKLSAEQGALRVRLLEQQLDAFKQKYQGQLTMSLALESQYSELQRKLQEAQRAETEAVIASGREGEDLLLYRRNADLARKGVAEQSALTVGFLEQEISAFKEHYQGQLQAGASPALEAQYNELLQRLQEARVAASVSARENAKVGEDNVTPAVGRIVKRIDFRGLSDAQSAALQARLQVHLGDTLTRESAERIESAVQQIDNRLAIAYLVSEKNGVEIRIGRVE